MVPSRPIVEGPDVTSKSHHTVVFLQGAFFFLLMKGIFAVFSNPTAHELKAQWAVDEREALDLLTMVSVVHRRLERAVHTPRQVSSFATPGSAENARELASPIFRLSLHELLRPGVA